MESPGPTSKGMIHQQTIFVSPFCGQCKQRYRFFCEQIRLASVHWHRNHVCYLTMNFVCFAIDHQMCLSKALFTLEINFQRKSSKFFFRKWALFTLEINFRKPTSTKPMDDTVDASFDVCKHRPTDQSERSISEISSVKFRKIEHVLNCEIRFRNLFLSKVDCSH